MTEVEKRIVAHINEESSNFNLENRVEASQERIFATETAGKIISEAQLLRSFDERKNEGAVTQSVSQKYGSTLSEKALYQIGKDFGIDSSYIDRIIESSYPPEEQKRNDIIKFNSIPSEIQQIAPIYLREIKKIVATQMPFDRLSIEVWKDWNNRPSPNRICVNRIIEEKEIEKRKLLMPWKTKKEKMTETERVADVSLHLGKPYLMSDRDLAVNVTSEDPVFLNKCGEHIKYIGEFFPTLNIEVSFEHTYNIDSK